MKNGIFHTRDLCLRALDTNSRCAEMESSVSKIEDFEMLDERIVRAVREMGFETLSPIQEQAIPFLLEGEDIIGQAQTGTGKTAAFGIPVLAENQSGGKEAPDGYFMSYERACHSGERRTAENGKIYARD